MKTKTLGFIGGGRITKIFLSAFQRKESAFQEIVVYDHNPETTAALKKQFPQIQPASSPMEAAGQDMVFLAVHPPVMMETLEKIKETVTANTVVISLAPKISAKKMEAVLPTQKLVRMIPNATSHINKGINPLCFHSSFTEDEKESLLKMLKVLGKNIEVEEKMLEGYAIVSAMLPTYFWFQWKKMADIAVKTGFTGEEANKLIRQTLKRSIKLYYDSGLSPEEVMDLIPVKPIGEHEGEIENILETRLMGLYEKIKAQG
jgi:pyrroline-5-carboxylate reductase